MTLENLEDLQAEWAEFTHNRSGPRRDWSQDQRWRVDNPGKLDELLLYRSDRSKRPGEFENAEPGSPERRMLEHLDAWWLAKGDVEPPPPPPPTGSELRWSPTKAGLPGWTGGPTTLSSSFPNYTLIVPTNGAQTLNLDNSKDYYIDLSFINYQSGDNGATGRSLGLHINGGRHVVIVGATILFKHTSRNDASGILVDQGNPDGVVFIEGLHIESSNCIVTRTARKIYIQNSRLIARKFLDNGQDTDLHSDCIQIWGASYSAAEVPMKGLFLDKVSMYCDFSAIVPSIEINHDASRGFPMVDPLVFEFWRTDMHPRLSNKIIVLYMYAASGLRGDVLNNGPYPARIGESWAEPSMHPSGFERKIDDVVITVDLSPQLKTLPYEIRSPDGRELWASPSGNVGGNAPYDIAGKAGVGNYLSFSRVPNMKDHKWWIGTPPASRGAVNGQFCPDGVAGKDYKAPGYVV
jgi:hypothetical protein